MHCQVIKINILFNLDKSLVTSRVKLIFCVVIGSFVAPTIGVVAEAFKSFLIMVSANGESILRP